MNSSRRAEKCEIFVDYFYFHKYNILSNYFMSNIDMTKYNLRVIL